MTLQLIETADDISYFLLLKCFMLELNPLSSKENRENIWH